jgi:hypothetical protein
MPSILKKVERNIDVQIHFDASFLRLYELGGLSHSVNIEQLRQSSGQVVKQFVTYDPNGVAYFNLDGLQEKLKGALEPFLNKIFSEQLTAFNMVQTDVIVVDASPILQVESHDIIYISFYTQDVSLRRAVHPEFLSNIKVH